MEVSVSVSLVRALSGSHHSDDDFDDAQVAVRRRRTRGRRHPLMMVVFVFERGNEDFLFSIGKIFNRVETSKTDAKNVRKRPSFAREGEERIVVLRLVVVIEAVLLSLIVVNFFYMSER